LLQQIINGLVLGSMYALLALGYTMVYGIINLINFAHGEVLMVGALTSWTVVGVLQQYAPWYAGLAHAADFFLWLAWWRRRFEFRDRKNRLPTVAQCAETRAIHHGHWRVYFVANIGHGDLETQLQVFPHVVAQRADGQLVVRSSRQHRF
jgi:branched-subunit amino acid ABC-type transport system permease component